MSKEKKYYLVKTITTFYGPKGDWSEGGEYIGVEHTSEYNDLDARKIYSEDLEILEEDFDKDFHAEDGYTKEFTTLRFKEIGFFEYTENKEAIERYIEILNDF